MRREDGAGPGAVRAPDVADAGGCDVRCQAQREAYERWEGEEAGDE